MKEFLDGGLLESVEEETFMIYAQTNASGGVQIGILAALDVDDCRNKVVKRHELCIPESDAPVPQKVKLYQVPLCHRSNTQFFKFCMMFF